MEIKVTAECKKCSKTIVMFLDEFIPDEGIIAAFKNIKHRTIDHSHPDCWFRTLGCNCCYKHCNC